MLCMECKHYGQRLDGDWRLCVKSLTLPQSEPVPVRPIMRKEALVQLLAKLVSPSHSCSLAEGRETT